MSQYSIMSRPLLVKVNLIEFFLAHFLYFQFKVHSTRKFTVQWKVNLFVLKGIINLAWLIESLTKNKHNNWECDNFGLYLKYTHGIKSSVL